MKPPLECQRQILVLCLIAEKGVNPASAWFFFNTPSRFATIYMHYPTMLPHSNLNPALTLG